ncbi:hypothetical protein SAMN05216388_101814 [Halorientalis persicus]|uniref:Uncharacterized protein n=1 Tax=Halorientalis persicus TaxID=1367881 RepID=A0A1H8S754_9EURY|nr:hypothetical protein [Halorientalis persicus]SEO74550.1 hypothetical protein SAMN05216388_101814 [Halorientalis persicus]
MSPLSMGNALTTMFRDACRTVGVLLVSGLAIAVLSLWHRTISSVQAVRDGPGDEPHDNPEILEYELDWYRYIKAFDAHHGPGGGPDRAIDSGMFVRGLREWLATRCLRGYTLENEVYVCPKAPQILRVHQAGHAPAFGKESETLVQPRRENGGLDDEPLYTLDVMLPGDFPHTLLRLRDPRGLTDRYEAWLRDGNITRVRA